MINHDKEFERSMKINKDRTIADFYEATINEYKRVKKTKRIDYEFVLLYKNALLNSKKDGNLEVHDIEDGAIIEVMFKEYEKPSAFKKVS